MLPKFLSGFLVKRIAAAVTGGLAMVFGKEYASQLSELLMDPDFINQVFNWIGGGLMIYAAIVKKDVSGTQAKLDEVEQTITEYLPKEMDLDPYPGWDYDPIQGWVKSES
jgi:hypothetical protein